MYSQELWHLSLVLALGRKRQEDRVPEFQASLDYKQTQLKKKKKPIRTINHNRVGDGDLFSIFLCHISSKILPIAVLEGNPVVMNQ